MEYTIETLNTGDLVYHPVLTVTEKKRRQQQLEYAAQRFAKNIHADKNKAK